MIIKNIIFCCINYKLVHFIFVFLVNSNSQENNSKYYSSDNGVLSLMYHRFNENKYPSTNIKMEIFDKQMNSIKDLGYKFYDPKLLKMNL